MIPFIDLMAVVSAAWLLCRAIGNLGHMTRRTSWIAYIQALSIAAAATGLLLSYSQWLIPGAVYVSFLNVGDATAMLVSALVVGEIIDPRRRARLAAVRSGDACVVQRSAAHQGLGT